MKQAALLIAAALLAGCASTIRRETPLAVSPAPGMTLETAPFAESLLAQTHGTSVDTLVGAWKENAFSAECVMKGDGEKLTIVFLAPQMRLGTLVLERPHMLAWTPSPRIPRVFEPEYLLLDLAFAKLDPETFRRALPAGYAFEASTAGRTLKSSDGTILLTLTGHELVNPVRGYRYTIEEAR